MAYVLPLVECPDGAELSAGMKSILLVLANCHNPHARIAWPSMPTIALYSRLSEDSVRRHLRFMQDHYLIEQRKPTSQGAGMKCAYVFLFLDDPERMQQLLQEKSKGLQGAPLFSPAERVAEGSQSTGQKGSRRVATAPRNKEELNPRTELNPNTTTAGCGKPGMPIWEKLHPNFVAKVNAELEKLAEASVGDGWSFSAHTPDEVAGRCRERMLRAATNAGLWPHVAKKIADEFAESARHEELEKLEYRLRGDRDGDSQYA